MKDPCGNHFCDRCGAEFQPTGRVQKFCPACGELNAAEKQRGNPIETREIYTCPDGWDLLRVIRLYTGKLTPHYIALRRAALVAFEEHRKRCQQCHDLDMAQPTSGYHSREYATTVKRERQGVRA